MQRHKFLILAVIIFLFWYLWNYFHVDIEAIEKLLVGFPLFYSAVIFILLYCVLTFFFWLLKDAFRVAAALIFGPYISTLFIWMAEIVNVFILFYLARFLGRDFVEKFAQKKFKGLDDKLERASLLTLFLFRATPLVPFRFLDIFMGLTKIDFRKYLVVSILGSPVRIFWVQYILSGAGVAVFKDPYALARYFQDNKMVYIASLAYLAVLIFTARRLSKIINKK